MWFYEWMDHVLHRCSEQIILRIAGWCTRHRERPQRPYKIWTMDVSKQVFSSGAGHICGACLSKNTLTPWQLVYSLLTHASLPLLTVCSRSPSAQSTDACVLDELCVVSKQKLFPNRS